MRNQYSRLLKISLTLVGLLSGLSCGNAKSGLVALNDPTPSGQLVGSGAFTPITGTATGIVQSYRSDCSGSSCTYTIRLQSFTVVNDSALKLVVQEGASTLSLQPPLRGTTGNQNYSFPGVTTAPTLVTLRPLMAAPPYTTDVASAIINPQ